MRSTGEQKPGFSISFRQLLLAMCLILLAVSVGSVSYMQMFRSEEILDRAVEINREALHAFVTSMDSSLQELESFLFNTFRDNSNLDTLTYESSIVRKHQAKTAILDLLEQALRLSGAAQGAFLLLPGQPEPVYLARYLNSPASVKEAERIRTDILSLTEDNLASNDERKWNPCFINGKSCMIRMARTGNAICGVWISCDSYLESCSRFLAFSSADSLSFISENETAGSVSAQESNSPEDAGNSTETASAKISGQNPEGIDMKEPGKLIHIDVSSQTLPTAVRLSLSKSTLLNQAQIRFDYVWYVTTILLVIIMIVLAFQLFMYHPILRLSSEVHALKGDDEPKLIHEDYQLRELADLSRYINQTICKLREMKIRNYETLLSEQQTAQEYLLMRHKTHFFINCISVIHALVIEKNDALISEMAVSLTDYLRKIDYENQEFVRLDDELGLIHSYIHIQKIRFGDSFRFIEEVPIDLFEAQIPPLILQTFVENAVEHARIHEKDNLICLKAAFVPGAETNQTIPGGNQEPTDMLVIDIIDNGLGFPEEFRQELANPAQVRRLSQGHGVGISNAIARLKHIYHDQAEIAITNEPGGGAHIHLCLPVLDQEESEEM